MGKAAPTFRESRTHEFSPGFSVICSITASASFSPPFHSQKHIPQERAQRIRIKEVQPAFSIYTFGARRTLQAESGWPEARKGGSL